MPFTLSHAAAVLPFRRSGFIVSAFVAGTFGPDFEYFLLLAPRSRYGHHWPGVLFFTLPACLLALWLFHALIKKPAAALLPSSIEQRIAPYLGAFRFGGARRFLHIVLSISAGIATHILWDSFTHSHTWATQHWPILLKGFAVPIFGALPLYQILQHASTLLGLTALTLWFVAWFRAEDPRVNVPKPYPSTPTKGLRPAQKFAIVSGMVLVAAAGAAIRILCAAPPLAHSHPTARLAIVLGVSAVSFLAIELFTYSLWWTLARPKAESDG